MQTAPQPPAETAPTDPFLVDQEALAELAPERIIARGVRYFEEHRVMLVARDGDRLDAQVEGSERDPYDVVVEADEEGTLFFECTCPYDYSPVCKHAVAALLKHVADQEGARLAGAADQALADRRMRAKTEVRVEPIIGDGGIGTWSARSVKGRGRRYEVEIRSLDEPLNSCTCPDYAHNMLGTCKHIEAALHRIRKRHRVRRTRAEARRLTFVHLDRGTEAGPAVAVHRGAGVSDDLTAVLDRHFRADGRIRGAMPDAFYALQRDLEDVDGELHIGAEVVALTERMMAERVHAHTADRLARTIRQQGGCIPGLKTHLYPYQVQGVAFLASRGRALLADDMGLGKTIQAIGACSVLMQEAGVERVLVVCPASLKSQWQREVERFTGRSTQVVQGGVQTRMAQYRARKAFTIVNYELVLRDHDMIDRLLGADVLVLDEAQRIRNWKTRTADAIKALHTRYAFVLTGTPLENRLIDLYSVMQVVDGRVLGPLWRFMADFHVTDDTGKVLGYRNLSELRRRLAPVMMRRNRDIVAAQLPERVVERREVPLSKRQADIHDGALMSAQNIMRQAKNQKRPLTPGEVKLLMAKLQNARMACNAAGLVDKETVGSPKLTELSVLLHQLCVDGDRKVVLFSQWERMTVMVKEVCDALGLGVVRLHGGVPTRNRGALIRRFEEDPSIRVFLSTDAGATGLNLQAASALINLDLPWNPALLDQRIARVHRLGQQRHCLIILLVASPSYEDRVWQILGGKRQLFGAVVSGVSDEDAVGLSQRSVELAMEAAQSILTATADTPPGPEHAEPVEDEPVATASADEDIEPEPGPAPMGRLDRPTTDDEGESMAGVVADLQRGLGARLERVLVSGRGIIAVVRGIGEADWELAQRVGRDGLPVVLVDPRSWQGLSAMPGGPADNARAVYDAAEPASEPAVNPLFAAAERKVGAAEVLLQSGCEIDAMALLADAMLAAIAARAGRDDVPSTSEAAAWLYAEAAPAGHVSMQDAGLVIRADALHRSGAVPAELAAEVLVDARRITSPLQ